jgi:hypothetical protein
MRKALSEERAFRSPQHPSVKVRAVPASEGLPFNWVPYFYGVHNRNPDKSESDGVLGRNREDSPLPVLVNASRLPPAG